MLDAIIDTLKKAFRAKTYSFVYLEVTQERKFNSNEVFVCHTHSSSGSPTGYISESELIQEHHAADEHIITQNTGFIRFFGTSPSAKGFLFTVLETEIEVGAVVNEKNEVQKLIAHENENE
jgi:hypothetical protein